MISLFTTAGRGLLVSLAATSTGIVAVARLAPRSTEPALTMVPTSTPMPQTITARGDLIEDNKPGVGCGVFEIWTILDFDVSSDPKSPSVDHADVKHLPVAIPCADLPRRMHGPTAGNAGILVKGQHYLLTLDAPQVSGKWGKTIACAAERIDDDPSP